MPRTSLERILRGRGMTSGPSYYRYADDFDPGEGFEGRRKRAVGAWAGGPRPARVFDDSAAAARAYRVEAVTIRKSIATGRPRFEAPLGWDVTLAWICGGSGGFGGLKRRYYVVAFAARRRPRR